MNANRPNPSSESARRTMRSNRRRDTGPELELRRRLHAMGLRYRVDHPLRCDGGRPIRPDIVFTRARVAVFVDGCFWHGCLEHQVIPRSNRAYWEPKLRRNVERDLETNRRLRDAGWSVLRIWEHEDPGDAGSRVAVAVQAAMAAAGASAR